MNDYSEEILDHYENPNHFGRILNADKRAYDLNPLCGDHLIFEVKLDNGKIKDVKYSGNGCAISQATADLLIDEMIGKSFEELKSINSDYVLKLVGIKLSPARIKCALLSFEILKKLINPKNIT